VIRRGELYWAQLRPPAGSEPGYRRPVLVLQIDALNRSRIATVLVAVVTRNLRLGEARGNVALAAGEGGLPDASVVNVSQLVTLDRGVIGDRLGALAPQRLAEVEAGVRLVLGL
jgi:mRNA interferase MazF